MELCRNYLRGKEIEIKGNKQYTLRVFKTPWGYIFITFNDFKNKICLLYIYIYILCYEYKEKSRNNFFFYVYNIYMVCSSWSGDFLRAFQTNLISTLYFQSLRNALSFFLFQH